MAENDAYTGGSDRLEITDDEIKFTLTGNYGDEVNGWAEAREDLGLNRAGPDPVKGVELADEAEHYYEDDETSYPYAYGPVTLKFRDVEALEAATDRLFDKATERFEWGDASGGEKVQDIASALPTSYDVEQVETNALSDTDNEQLDEAEQ